MKDSWFKCSLFATLEAPLLALECKTVGMKTIAFARVENIAFESVEAFISGILFIHASRLLFFSWLWFFSNSFHLLSARLPYFFFYQNLVLMMSERSLLSLMLACLLLSFVSILCVLNVINCSKGNAQVTRQHSEMTKTERTEWRIAECVCTVRDTWINIRLCLQQRQEKVERRNCETFFLYTFFFYIDPQTCQMKTFFLASYSHRFALLEQVHDSEQFFIRRKRRWNWQST